MLNSNMQSVFLYHRIVFEKINFEKYSIVQLSAFAVSQVLAVMFNVNACLFSVVYVSRNQFLLLIKNKMCYGTFSMDFASQMSAISQTGIRLFPIEKYTHITQQGKENSCIHNVYRCLTLQPQVMWNPGCNEFFTKFQCFFMQCDSSNWRRVICQEWQGIQKAVQKKVKWYENIYFFVDLYVVLVVTATMHFAVFCVRKYFGAMLKKSIIREIFYIYVRTVSQKTFKCSVFIF